MQAFGVLTRARESGVNGPQPIKVSEILAYLQLAEVASPEQRVRFTSVLQGLDGAYLAYAEAKVAKST